MVLAAAISVMVVISGVDLVTLVLSSSIIRAAVLVPLILSILWSRMNAAAFTSGTIIGLIAGAIALSQFGEATGTYTVTVVSTVVPILIALASSDRFDYSSLRQTEGLPGEDSEASSVAVR